MSRLNFFLQLGLGLAIAFGDLGCHKIGLAQVDPSSEKQEGAKKYVISEQATKIHADGYVWDGHNDLPWKIRETNPKKFEERDIRRSQPDLDTDIERLRKGNVGAQFWSVFVPVDTIRNGTSFQTTVEQIQLVHDMVKTYPDVFELALNIDDVDRIRASGKIASLIGMEGGHSIENSIRNLQYLHSQGARYMTLTHADTLDWADAATDTPRSDGLSPFGEEVVREMNRLGMLVDLSHVSPETMDDALRVSSAPVIFSHSSAKAIADHPRNVPDEILRKLPANGGVVMINFFSGFVVPKSAKIMKDMFAVRRSFLDKFGSDKEAVSAEMKKWEAAHPYPQGDASVVVDHIAHIAKVAGIDHVGLGSDFDGIARSPIGLEDVASYPVLTELMLQRGFSAEDIHKVMSGNIHRVFAATKRE